MNILRFIKNLFKVILFGLFIFMVGALIFKLTFVDLIGIRPEGLSTIVRSYTDLSLSHNSLLFEGKSETISYYWDDKIDEAKTISGSFVSLTNEIPLEPGKHILHYYAKGRFTHWNKLEFIVPDEETQKSLIEAHSQRVFWEGKENDLTNKLNLNRIYH